MTLAQNSKNFQTMKKQGLVVPTPSPAKDMPVPPINAPYPNPNFSSGPLPAISMMQPDMQRTFYSPAAAQDRLAPPSATNNAVTGAQAISQTILNVGSGGSGPLLETNNQKNAVQSVLNLVAGTNISLSSDARGDVTIANTATNTGDGLIHGDSIWWVDSAWVMLRDDFNNPSSTTAPSQTWGNGLNWTIINPGTFNAIPGGAFPLNGVLAMSPGSSANTYGGVLYKSGASSGGNGFPLLDYPGWKVVWEFQISRNNSSSPAVFSWTQVSLYVGLGSYVNNNPAGSDTPRPPYFMGLRYDTDTTAPAISDTQFVFEYVNNLTNTTLTRINTQGTTFATGITVTEGRKYRFEMSCFASGSVTFFLTDSVTTASTTLSVSKISFTSPQPSFTSSNGIILVDYSGKAIPIELGSVVTVSGGTIAAGNATYVHAIPRGATNEAAVLSGATPSGADTSATTTLFPGLAPLFWIGNDTTATPVANSKGVLIDMFALVWNKGLITGGATPNSTLARYW